MTTGKNFQKICFNVFLLETVRTCVTVISLYFSHFHLLNKEIIKREIADKGRVQKKKCGIFHTLVGGVGGFLKVIFHKKIVSKCIKSPKYSFKSNLFFSYGGVYF